MFRPNTVQVPYFLIKASLAGRLSFDETRAMLAIAARQEDRWELDPQAVATIRAALERGVIPEHETPSEEPSSAPVSDNVFETPFAKTLQTLVDKKIARPVPIREEAMSKLYGLAQGRVDVAEAMVAIAEAYERRAGPIKSIIGFFFKILRESSLDQLVTHAEKASRAPDSRLSLGAEVHRRVQARLESQGVTLS